MLIERQKRMSRVRFKHPIRVVTLEGQPRVIRTLTANVSRKGLFLRMPEPLPLGTKVALSLEAGGRALALAQAEVVWGRVHESQLPGRFPGCGVRFTEFMHPRAQELVDYLVHNLDRGKPLLLAPPERAWMRWLPAAGGAALLACAALATLLLWPSSTPGTAEEDPEGPTLEMVAAPPLVHPVRPTAALEPSTLARGEDPAVAMQARSQVALVQPAPDSPKATMEAVVQPAPSAPEAPLSKKADTEFPSAADAPVAKKQAAPEAPPANTGAESPVAKMEAAPSPEAPLAKTDAESPVAKKEAVPSPEAPLAKTDAESPVAKKEAVPSAPEAPPAKTGADSPVAKKEAVPSAPEAPPAKTGADSPVAKKALALVQPAAPEPKAPVAGKTDSAPKAPVARKTDAEASSSAAVEKKGIAPLREAAVARPVVAPKVATAKSEGGKIKLPSGAAPSLSWTLKGSELRLSPELPGQAQVTRAFVLAGPPRAVFDITGSTPSRSHTVPASPPYSTAVRLGKLPSGTRLVIDLDAAPRRSSQDGSSLVLSF